MQLETCLDSSGDSGDGLTIDSQWTFGPHFKLLVPKVTTTANALSAAEYRWGRNRSALTVWEEVIRSRVLYGAPDFPTGLPGSPEALIYQHLTLTPTGLERRPWSALSKRARGVCRAPAGRSSRGGSFAPSLFPLPPSEA